MAEQNNTTGNICAEEYVVKRGDSFYLIAHKLGVPLRDLLAANRDIHPARLMVGDVLCIPREEEDLPGTGGLGGGTTGGTTGSGTTGGGTTGSGTTGGTTGSGTTGGTTGNGATGGGTGGGTMGGTTGSGATGGTTGSGATGGTTGSGATTEPTPSCAVDDQWIVQKGQTAADLQLRNLVSRHTLEVSNPGVDLETLRVGQTLCIPKENVPCPLPRSYTIESTENLEGVAVRFNLPVASLLRANPCLAPQDFEPGVTISLPN